MEALVDPESARKTRGMGAFGWNGAFGTVSWTDPTNGITAVYLVQLTTMVVFADFEEAIRQAILE